MARRNNIYESLLQQGYSKREIHAVLHKCVLEIIEDEKKNSNKQEMLILKQVQEVQHDVSHDITPKKNHPHPLVYFLRKVNIRKHVIGKALSLLESQFAKKPKNPV